MCSIRQTCHALMYIFCCFYDIVTFSISKNKLYLGDCVKFLIYYQKISCFFCLHTGCSIAGSLALALTELKLYVFIGLPSLSLSKAGSQFVTAPSLQTICLLVTTMTYFFCLSLVLPAPVFHSDCSHHLQPVCWLWLPWLHECGCIGLLHQPHRSLQQLLLPQLPHQREHEGRVGRWRKTSGIYDLCVEEDRAQTEEM